MELKINEKESTLFANSEIGKDYPWLVELMKKENGKYYLSKKKYDSISESNKRIIDLSWKKIFNRAQEEWTILDMPYDKDIADGEIECELCGHKHLKKISRIRNIINNTELIVGSECIQDFYDIEGNSKEDIQVKKEKSRKERRRLKYINNVEKTYPGITNIINRSRNITSDNTIIFPDSLKTDLVIANKMINIYDKEINKEKGGTDKSKMNEVYDILVSFNDKINQYKRNSNEAEWGISADIAKWVHANGNEDLIKNLKKYGKITIETVDQILEPNFLSYVIKKYTNILEKNYFTLIAAKGTIFEIQYNSRDNIVLCVKSLDFLRKYKHLLFGINNSDKIVKEDILPISEVKSSSFNKSLNYITRNGKLAYKVLFDDTSINELAFKVDDKIKVVNYSIFVNHFKNNIYRDNKKLNTKTDNRIVEYIDSNSDIYDLYEYKDHLKSYGIELKI